MKHCLLSLLCLVIYAASISSARAQEQEKEKESFAQPIQEFPFMEAVYLQEQHEIQSTLSFYHTDEDASISNALGYEAEYGFTDWLQVSAELTHNHWHSKPMNYNVYQLEAGTMVGLLSSPRQALSFEMEVEFPLNKPESAGEEAEGTEVSYTPVLLYARQLGDIQVHLNAGAEIQAHEHGWFYNAAAVYGTGNWHPLLEVNGTYEEKANWYLAPGLALNNDSGWEFVAGIRRSLPESDWGFAVKVLFEFTAGKH